MTLSRGGDYRDEKKIFSFHEPEKTTSWKDRDAKEPSIELVDHELEKAKRRTAELKALMSPPGALRLPELLDQQRLKWGIPDGAFAARAIFDRIHIFPIDPEGQKETWGTGSIYRPASVKTRDVQNGHRGILISMGLTAADHCVSHGTELGHIVRTIRNAPHVEECARLVEGGPMYYLIMRDGDLTGDETLEEQLRSGEKRIVEEGGEHSFCFNIEGRKKRVALIRDNW